MKKCLYIVLVFMIASLQDMAQNKHDVQRFEWSQLAQIPDAHGFAGSFAGVSNGTLIVAGGANFPNGGGPWTGAKKAWSDKIFVLEKPDGQWKLAGKLPHPLGYGVSITWNDQLLCFGGSDEKGHYASVIGIAYQNGKTVLHHYPDMPSTLANCSGVLVGHTVYIAGGLVKPDDKQAAHVFWSMDLSAPLPVWKVLPAWPGPGCMLAVAGHIGNDIYLFSGASLHDDGKGGAKRTYLTNTYCYKAGKGWHKLKDMPYATVASAGPAYQWQNKLYVFGGDDGKLVEKANELRDNHPGFADQILRYDVAADQWTIAGKVKTDKKADAAAHPNASTWTPVTTCLAEWNGKLIFAGGEVRPAVRTPRVLVATPVIK